MKESNALEYDIVVVGGGPAGARTAARIARKGARVLILEEHAEAGKPLQCAGIVSTRIRKLAEFEVPVIEEMKSVTLFPPNGNPYTLATDEVKAHIIDRSEYDRRAIAHAEKCDAEVLFSARCTAVETFETHAEVALKIAKKVSVVRCKLVIGADGPDSVVRGCLDCDRPIDKLYGVQAHIPKGRLPRQKGHVELHIGSEVAPGFFAWVIPAGDHFRVGLCTSQSPKKYLRKFIARLGLEYDEDWDVQAGIIPLAYLEKTYGRRILLVGDAACQVKPLSGGGLYTGIICADICADVALEALANEKFDAKSLSRYQNLWSAEIGKEIKRGLVLRRAYLQMKDSQLDEVVDVLRSEKLVALVVALGDIDFPSRAAKAVLLKSPKLIKFSPVLLKSLL